MKITDDYNAKFKIWARESKVHPLPVATDFPRFGSRKFNSYEEFNAWKQGFLKQIAANGGVKWTK